MPHDPTLLFGVGATKAGTTWLYHYLSGHPQCHLRTRKELHFFDQTTPEARERALAQATQKATALSERAVAAKGPMRHMIRQRFNDALDWMEVLRGTGTAPYLRFLHHGAGAARLVGDITPSYTLLPLDTLRMMATLSPDTRFVYLMRDPVARLWSHVRMNAAKATETDAAFAAKSNAILNMALRGALPEMRARGDYNDALAKLSQLPPEQVCILFYEDLFDDGGVARLCDFLGLDYAEPDTQTRHHEGKRLKMTPEQQSAARTALMPQYDGVAARLGRLPEAWINMRDHA